MNGRIDVNCPTCRAEDYNEVVVNGVRFVRENPVGLIAECDRLRDALKQATEYCECAHCRTRMLKNPLHVLEHMQTCEKHPMRELERKLAETISVEEWEVTTDENTKMKVKLEKAMKCVSLLKLESGLDDSEEWSSMGRTFQRGEISKALRELEEA